jgi:hypothetical protein
MLALISLRTHGFSRIIPTNIKHESEISYHHGFWGLFTKKIFDWLAFSLKS